MYLLRGIQGSIGNSNPLRSGYRLLKTKTEIYFYLGIWKMDPSPWPKHLTCPLSDPYEQVGMKHLPRKCFLFVNVCFSYPTCLPRSPRSQIHVHPTYTLSSLALDRVTRRRGIKTNFPSPCSSRSSRCGWAPWIEPIDPRDLAPINFCLWGGPPLTPLLRCLLDVTNIINMISKLYTAWR